MIVNYANSGREITLWGVPVVVLIPIVLWVILPFAKKPMFFVSCVFVSVVWLLHYRGWTLRAAIRRLRRILSGSVLPATPWWRKRGW